MLDRAVIAHFAPGEGLAAGAHAAGFDDTGWLPAAVPGDVHRTLIDAGEIPDPFVGQNETACAWMEEREWWYRLRFSAPAQAPDPDERLRLVFHGLDTFVTVWLDGEELGRHQNMFRPAVFEVTDRLRPDEEHVLALRFDRPLDHIAGKTLSAWGRNPERTAMRKAQFGYGWDWGPRLPTIGIWRPVELRRERRATITGLQFSTIDLTPAHDRAAVAVRVEAEHFSGDQPLAAQISLTSPDGATTISGEIALPATGGEVEATAYLTVDNPELWWTHDLGPAPLYDLQVRLDSGADVVDAASARVGIRTLTLDQSPDPDERGTRFFRFVLNGVPIFARGADWIPCDSFVGAIPPERYARLIEAARDANMTMLRIWGGGIYEHDRFYLECDRLGLLVWQDFMFACAMYPEDDPDFVAEVDAEARYQVRRLRSHPCLALWCGNNENQWLHDIRNWDNPSPPPYGELYYNQILPAAVSELDGRTPYWPGSPFGGNDHNSMLEGNRHNWDVWHGQFPRRFGEPFRQEFTAETVTFLRYGEDVGRFVSEFGMHAAPSLETLRTVIPADELYHHSSTLDWHNKDNPKNKGDLLLETVTGLPADLDEYIDFSQIAQAEGLKFANEHYRRRKPHCSGALVWQFNDCWPCLSWSVLDYYGVGKAGYWYLRRAFAPILASFQPLADDGVALWITNDTLRPISDRVSVFLSTLDGGRVGSYPVDVEVAANTSVVVQRWNASDPGPSPDRYLSVSSSAGLFPTNRHFFTAIKDLKRRPAAPKITITPTTESEVVVDLHGQDSAYTILTHLSVPGHGIRYSDNYFDLAPGEHRTITISSSTGRIDPAAVQLRWR